MTRLKILFPTYHFKKLWGRRRRLAPRTAVHRRRELSRLQWSMRTELLNCPAPSSSSTLKFADAAKAIGEAQDDAWASFQGLKRREERIEKRRPVYNVGTKNQIELLSCYGLGERLSPVKRLYPHARCVCAFVESYRAA